MAKTKILVIAIVLMAIVTGSAFAQQYRVVFFAAGNEIWTEPGYLGNVGHAFVYVEGYGTYGFYPNGRVTKNQALLGVPGIIRDDSNHSYDASVSFTVTSRGRDNIISLINNWRRNPPEYQLMQNDCVSFVMYVADVIGLDYDYWTTQSPRAFVNSLDRNN